MRGKAIKSICPNHGNRITPAYAGKSIFINTFLQLFKDHPRLCGEKFAQYDAAFWEWGSPPPMRGKAPFSKSKPTFTGITPAYAGKSFRIVTKKLHVGSPPPMRGKVLTFVKIVASARITPAYAGKSADLCICHNKNQDHPRLCGEKTKKILKQRYFFHQPASFSFSLQYT